MKKLNLSKRTIVIIAVVAVLAIIGALTDTGTPADAGEARRDKVAELQEQIWNEMQYFQGTSWFGYIRGIKLSRSWSAIEAEVTTTLDRTKSADLETAGRICNIIWGNYISKVDDLGYDFFHVFIRDERGRSITNCGI